MLDIANNEGGNPVVFNLQSAIRLNTEELGSSENMIIGTSAILCNTSNRNTELLGLESNSFKFYDPKQVLLPVGSEEGATFRDPLL